MYAYRTGGGIAVRMSDEEAEKLLYQLSKLTEPGLDLTEQIFESIRLVQRQRAKEATK